MKPPKRVEVRNTESEQGFTLPLKDFVEQLRLDLESVPPEHRDAAWVSFNPFVQGYDAAGSRISVFYERPRTAEEIAEEQRANDARKAQMLANAKESYEKLREEVEGG
jgi:hypothetical protein